MRHNRLLLSILFAAAAAMPAVAQKRSSAPKELTFTDALVAAQKAFEAGEFGGAISALQAAIRDVQKKQRLAVLAALPKPAAFTVKDDDPKDETANPFAAGLAALGSTITRHYEGKDGKGMDVEVMANSPLVSMMSMMLSNPAIAKADGGELVEYGAHKALLKKNGDDGQELTIVMYDKHLVKVTTRSMNADELFAVFDQAAVDRLEKPLGK